MARTPVLAHLEQNAQRIAGQVGVYRLFRDDAGNLVAVIAGHQFIGTGTWTGGDNRFEILNGLLMQVSKL